MTTSGITRTRKLVSALKRDLGPDGSVWNDQASVCKSKRLALKQRSLGQGRMETMKHNWRAKRKATGSSHGVG